MMDDFLKSSSFFGMFASVAFYLLGIELKRRFRMPLFNPLLVAIAGAIVVVILFRIDYADYNRGMSIFNYLMTPATVCLAVPLYDEFSILKKNGRAIVLGVLAGVLTCMVTILIFAAAFHFDHTMFVTLLPKSITTAIGVGLCAEMGGNSAITVAAIVITGVLGGIFAETFLRLFHITEPVAKGVAIGTAAHAVGTAEAMKIGEIEGAMASLAIVVAGMLTVASANIFARFL